MKHFVLAGLGNKGEEYEGTRHNAGREALLYFARNNNISFEADSKKKALVGEGKIKRETYTLVLPENFMNNSGKVISSFVKNKKQAERLVVLYDDIDLPVGEMRISFNRGSGGHKGIDSTIRALGTKGFVRIRIGICPTTPTGKLRKPDTEKKILDFLMSQPSDKETLLFKKVWKKVGEAIETILLEGHVKAMNEHN